MPLEIEIKKCINCGENKPLDEFYCHFHAIRGKYFRRNECIECVKKRVRARALKLTESGLCRWCKARIEEGKLYCAKCTEKFHIRFINKYKYGSMDNVNRAQSRSLQHARLRVEIFNNYGGKCECCGESDFSKLTIDHILGDGKAHRNEIGTGNLYPWLKKNNFPKNNFRLLCYNCNIVLSKYNYCPHSQDELKTDELFFSKFKRKYILNLKLKTISEYGGECVSCGEKRPEFLTIDHVDGDGHWHRKNILKNKNFYVWLKLNNYPKDKFQLLCYNCNCSKNLNFFKYMVKHNAL